MTLPIALALLTQAAVDVPPQVLPQAAVDAPPQVLHLAGAQVEIVQLLPVVERHIAVPVKVTARGGNVVVRLCSDLRCSLAEEHTLAANETRLFMTNAANLGLLEARRGDSSARCCKRFEVARVVATTRPAGAAPRLEGVQAAIVDAGDLFADSPDLLSGISGLVIDDNTTRNPPNLIAWVRGGGVVSVPLNHELSLVEKRRRYEGSGIIITRLASEDPWVQATEVMNVLPLPSGVGHLGERSPAARAAEVAVAKVPWRTPIFFFALAAIVMSAILVKRASPLGWRQVLLRMLVVNGVACALIYGVYLVSIPATLERRVVARIMDARGVPWEVGAVAVRPRSTKEVTVTTPMPLEVVYVTGDDGRRHGELVRQVMTASARLPSSSALIGTWSGFAAKETVELRGDVIVNNLSVPVRALARWQGIRSSRGLPPKSEVPFHSLGWKNVHGDHGGDLLPEEERLLNEILASCNQRGGDPAKCTAAIAVLDDGTLYGVEIR